MALWENNKKNEILKKTVQNGIALEETLSTRGWQDIIEPLFKENIFNIVGGYKDGKYYIGSIESFDCIKDVKTAMGAKEALIDIHNTIVGMIKKGLDAKLRLEEKEKPKIIKNKFEQVG